MRVGIDGHHHNHHDNDDDELCSRFLMAFTSTVDLPKSARRCPQCMSAFRQSAVDGSGRDGSWRCPACWNRHSGPALQPAWVSVYQNGHAGRVGASAPMAWSPLGTGDCVPAPAAPATSAAAGDGMELTRGVGTRRDAATPPVVGASLPPPEGGIGLPCGSGGGGGGDDAGDGVGPPFSA